MNAEQQAKQWGQVVAKAWQDDAFKKRLLSNPSVVLKEHGLEMPSGVQIRVVENSDQVVHLTLPAQPQDDELSEDALDAVAGGLCGGCMAFAVQALKKGPTTGGAGGGSGSGTGPTTPPLPPRTPPCGMG